MRQRAIRIHGRAMIILFVGFFACQAAVAQERSGEARRSLTVADYAQAEKFMSYNVAPLLVRAGVRPVWLPGDRLWYRNTLENDGSEFILVDPGRGTRAPVFDQAALASALSKVSGKTYDAGHLPFATFDLSADGLTVSFRAEGRQWSYDVKAKICKAAEGGREETPGPRRGGAGAVERPEMLSPDGRFAAFIRGDNLWVREVGPGT